MSFAELIKENLFKMNIISVNAFTFSNIIMAILEILSIPVSIKLKIIVSVCAFSASFLIYFVPLSINYIKNKMKNFNNEEIEELRTILNQEIEERTINNNQTNINDIQSIHPFSEDGNMVAVRDVKPF